MHWGQSGGTEGPDPVGWPWQGACGAGGCVRSSSTCAQQCQGTVPAAPLAGQSCPLCLRQGWEGGRCSPFPQGAALGLCHPTVPPQTPSPGPASPFPPETPVPGGILPDLRDDHGRVRPPGSLEEERAEEAGAALLNAVHYKYIHTYKYIHREISSWQLWMILGATGALPAPLRVNWSLADPLVLCVSFPFPAWFLCRSLGSPQSWCLSLLAHRDTRGQGRFSCFSHSAWGWERAGVWDGGGRGVSHPPLLSWAVG